MLQGVQTAAPALEYFPLEHKVQLFESAGANDPAGQEAHVDDPDPAAKVPAIHNEHEASIA